jgi:hypothetical protein
VIVKGDSEILVGVSGALHGSSSLTVVNVPHVCGLASGARGPPLKLNRRSLKGSWGFWANSLVRRPLCGSTLTTPGSLIVMPRATE